MENSRNYRVAKKEKDVDQVAELEKLEEKNKKLKLEEEQMRQKLEKAKKIYIDLIETNPRAREERKANVEGRE